MKLFIALLALSCFGQERYDIGSAVHMFPCESGRAAVGVKIEGGIITRGFCATETGVRVVVDLVNVKTLRQFGVPVPPSTTDHIRVTVTNLDPATVKVTIRLTYFEDGEETHVERTVSRTETGAAWLHYVRDAAVITSASATVEELGIIQ